MTFMVVWKFYSRMGSFGRNDYLTPGVGDCALLLTHLCNPLRPQRRLKCLQCRHPDSVIRSSILYSRLRPDSNTSLG